MSNWSNRLAHVVKVKVITDDKPVYATRNRLPYPKIERTLKKGEGVFIQDIRRQTAHAAAKIISNHLGEKYVAVPAFVGTVGIDRRIKGYTFEKESETD